MRRVEASEFRRYLPIGETDRAWGLHAIGGGYLRSAPGGVYPTAAHPARYRLGWRMGRVLDEFQLHYIARGGGSFESSEGRARRITAGTAFILFPGVWHRYQPDQTTGWDEWWIGFDGEHARRIMSPPFFSARQPVLEAGERGELLEHFSAIVALLRDDPPHMQRLLAGRVALLLGTLQARLAGEAVDARGARALQEAKRRISAAATHAIDGQVLARSLGVNYHWLRRAFRQQLGMSLHEYHLQLRMHAAMQLLESSDREVGDIAGELGFEDPYYFSRVFRKEVGASPQRWRRQRRGLDLRR
jgi:AraC-like DNA-binding protein